MVFMAQNGALPRTPAHFGKMFGTPALSRHGFYSQSDSEGFDVPGVLNTRGGEGGAMSSCRDGSWAVVLK